MSLYTPRWFCRFAATIKGQFYGHTHFDEFKVFFNRVDKRPSNVAHVGPSLTPFENLNYGYKIYHVDGLRGSNSTWVRNERTPARHQLISNRM